MHQALLSWAFMGAAQSLWSPAQPLPCLRCGTAELFPSKHRHVRAGAAWLGPTLCQGFLAHPAVLQLQLAWQLGPQPASKRAAQMAGSAPGASAAAERRLWITHGSAGAWAGTARLQVGQGSLPSHPARGRAGPPQFPSPALAKAAPLPVPCGYGLGHLQKEQSFSFSLRSLES